MYSMVEAGMCHTQRAARNPFEAAVGRAKSRHAATAYMPEHGSWLNIVETMFSKMARTMLRGIRVASKQELIDRIHLYFMEINADPVIFRWKYKMDDPSIG